jgi:hypothetical protein
MFCAKCGTQVEEGSKFCQKCGAAVPQTVTQAQMKSAQPAGFQPGAAIKNSGMAVASLVLGIVGMVFFPFVPSILAIIFGVIGTGQVKKSNGLLKGKGLATAGIILGIIAIVIVIIVIATLGFSMSWISDLANDMYN